MYAMNFHEMGTEGNGYRGAQEGKDKTREANTSESQNNFPSRLPCVGLRQLANPTLITTVQLVVVVVVSSSQNKNKSTNNNTASVRTLSKIYIEGLEVY